MIPNFHLTEEFTLISLTKKLVRQQVQNVFKFPNVSSVPSGQLVAICIDAISDSADPTGYH